MIAVLLSAALVAVALVGPHRAPRAVDDQPDATSNGFDLMRSLVPQDLVIRSGMPRDGLEVLDAPDMIGTDEVVRRGNAERGKFLVPSDRIVGIEINGATRAYPLRLLRWHEIVNDTVGGVPIVITYDGLSDAVVVADRRIGGRVMDFGISGLLLESNLLMYDRHENIRDSSLWSQLQARAVSGPMAGSGLRLLPAALAPWRDWRDAHPETLVLAPLDRLRTVYNRDPYNSYFGSDLLRYPVSKLPPKGDLRLKDRIVVLSKGDSRTVLALSRMARATGADSGLWTADVGGLSVEVRFDAGLGTAVAEIPDGVELGVRQAFWFAWYAQFPDTGDPLPAVPPPTR